MKQLAMFLTSQELNKFRWSLRLAILRTWIIPFLAIAGVEWLVLTIYANHPPDIQFTTSLCVIVLGTWLILSNLENMFLVLEKWWKTKLLLNTKTISHIEIGKHITLGRNEEHLAES
tara:strand:+ start:750 stop:1100 length:351 start_codon:yes stop_codon:yes gene_type:complete